MILISQLANLFIAMVQAFIWAFIDAIVIVTIILLILMSTVSWFMWMSRRRITVEDVLIKLIDNNIPVDAVSFPIAQPAEKLEKENNRGETESQ